MLVFEREHRGDSNGDGTECGTGRWGQNGVVFVVGKGTVKDLGLGLGSELRALRMESKHKIRGPKAQIVKRVQDRFGGGANQGYGEEGLLQWPLPEWQAASETIWLVMFRGGHGPGVSGRPLHSILT